MSLIVHDIRWKFLLGILLFAVSVAQAQDTVDRTSHPKVALVLSGGGAKGFVHIGVLKVLEEEGIPVDMIVGTSIGSLVGGIYAIGYHASEIEDMVKSQNWEKVLSDDVSRKNLSVNDQLLRQRYAFSLPASTEKKPGLPSGLIRGQNIMNLFCNIAANVPANVDFDKLPIQYACIATDLETGKEVILRNGFLPTAMFSSMAVPVVFQPSERDSLYLIDGGMANNFPSNVARKMGADIIIGVDIRNDIFNRENLKTANYIVGQMVNFLDQKSNPENDRICDLVIRPDVRNYQMTSFSKQSADTLILRGEKATYDLREQLRALKKKYHLEPNKISRKYVGIDNWYITDLSFSCNNQLDEKSLRKTLNLKIPGYLSSEIISEAIERLYGLGGFEKIYYNLVDTENGKKLNLNIVTENKFIQNVGFKANTTDAAAILLNATKKNYGKILGLLSAGVELSANPGLSVLTESNNTGFPTFGTNLKVKYLNYNLYQNQKKLSKANVFYNSFSFYVYQPFLKRNYFGIGIQEEYFHRNIYGNDNKSVLSTGKRDVFLTNAYACLSYDDLDDYYFPGKGTSVYSEISFNADWNKSDDIIPAFLFKMKNVLPIHSHMALLFDIYGRALFKEDFPDAKMTMVGGEPYSLYFNYYLPFVGLSAVNLAERYACIGLIGFRLQVSKTRYVSFLFNTLLQNTEFKPWAYSDCIYGGGVKFSQKTWLGPLDITLGYSDRYEQPCISANFGYWF
jgi:NTE family protein